MQRASQILPCAPGQILLTANTHTTHVFFPIDAVIAVVRRLDDGNAVELGIAGNDGMIGCDAIMDEKIGLDEAVVRSAGTAWCIAVEDFRRQFHRGGGLQKSLLRFMAGFVSQLAQNASCNRFHTIEGRVARWFLMIHERNSGGEIDMTGTAIAGTVRAEAAALEQVLAELVAAKMIRQRKSTVVVTDAGKLELRACDCYESLRSA